MFLSRCSRGFVTAFPTEAKTLTRKVHPAALYRENPFLKPVPAWLRDFKTFQPITMTFASAKIFNTPIRVDIMHRVVHWHLAGLRAGTASTKHRSDVRGSTRKIYQQKGLGRARAGSSRTHQRRGGARCFGPKPRKFYYTLPEKIRNLGLRSALSTKFSQGQLSFVSDESINLGSHKTGYLADILEKIPAKRILLIDSAPPNKNLMLAARSLDNSIVLMNVETDRINVYHILKGQFILLTDRAKRYYEQHFDSLFY